jgi:hypothetical protein
VNNDRDPRTVFSSHAILISRGLEALVLLTFIAGAIPFALAQPVWWLRLSDSAISLAPVILLAVILLRLSEVSIAATPTPRRQGFRTASRWAFVYGLLIPLQLIAFTWLWFDSDRQVNASIRQGERNRFAIQKGVLGSSSDRELQALLAGVNLGPLPAITAGSLADHKQQLTKAIDANGAVFSASLRRERSAMLRNSIPGTLRVLLGALIVGAILFTITGQL